MTAPAPLLVVDDDALSRRVLTRALELAGFPFEVVAGGDEALEWLATHEASLILLDLMMPPPDGYAVLKHLKSSEATKGVPVVVLTGLDDEETALRAVQEGAQDFLVKGRVDTPILTRSIRYAIERAATGAAQLLHYLIAQAQAPEFQVRWRWQPGSVAFWDNRLTQHYATADYLPARRVMHRALDEGSGAGGAT